MAKKTYYFTNKDGQEIKARTSEHEYQWFCLGRCSKTYAGALSEKTSRVREAQNNIAYYKKCLAKESELKRYANIWARGKSREEVIAYILERIDGENEYIEELKIAPVYELYTK